MTPEDRLLLILRHRDGVSSGDGRPDVAVAAHRHQIPEAGTAPVPRGRSGEATNERHARRPRRSLAGGCGPTNDELRPAGAAARAAGRECGESSHLITSPPRCCWSGVIERCCASGRSLSSKAPIPARPDQLAKRPGDIALHQARPRRAHITDASPRAARDRVGFRSAPRRTAIRASGTRREVSTPWRRSRRARSRRSSAPAATGPVLAAVEWAPVRPRTSTPGTVTDHGGSGGVRFFGSRLLARRHRGGIPAPDAPGHRPDTPPRFGNGAIRASELGAATDGRSPRVDGLHGVMLRAGSTVLVGDSPDAGRFAILDPSTGAVIRDHGRAGAPASVGGGRDWSPRGACRRRASGLHPSGGPRHRGHRVGATGRSATERQPHHHCAGHCSTAVPPSETSQRSQHGRLRRHQLEPF